MTTRAASGSASSASLAAVVDRVSRPGALTALALLAVGMVVGLTGDQTVRAERYPGLVIAVAGVAGGLLLLTAILPLGLQRRLRAGALAVAGVSLGVLVGNGLTTGPARLCLLAALLVAFATALPALVAQLESGLGRPRTRL